MTLLEDTMAQLLRVGCRVVLEENELHIRGDLDRLPSDLLAVVRRAKAALCVALLEEKARELTAFVDGDTPLSERQAKLPELSVLLDRLSAAQEELWASWRREGFAITWNPLVEEFILVGNGPPPLGAERFVKYDRQEAEALQHTVPEQVRRIHKLKKTFTWRVAVEREGGS